ncbi:nitrate- and nitrite sensing domain-containing protein [Pseudonocardia lutea]|uniref:histidine kinase n=1 Tax=Pseudonocardia lutea TaxID=2172015 RepID=A0ABW1I4Y4_9PSEU
MTSTERHPAWSERLNPRNWSLAAKLVAVGLVPTLLALVLGVLRISDQAGVAEQLGRDNRLLEIRQGVAATAQALQAERNTAVLFVAGGRTGDRGALDRAAAETDAKLGEVRAALADASQLDASGTTALQQAEGGFTQLPVLRTDAAASPAGTDDITTRYTTIVQRADVLERALIHQGETTYAGGLGDALAATGEAREALALQHTVLAGAIAAGRLSEQAKITVTGAAAAFATAFADYQVGLTPEQLGRYGNFATDGANVELERLRTQIMATPTERPLQADPAAWEAAYRQAAQVVERAGTGVADELTATSTQAQADASNKAGVNSVLLMLGVLLGIAIIVLLARSLIRSLRVLRRSALDVAERRLPQAVETMRSGQPLNAMVEPVPLTGRDEVGQVARAFDAVHGQAIRLAADQAALQANVSNMFVNLSRRSQALVERQLQLIEQLESNEQDPDQLSNLFQLDHLATRMRRNSENLLVLAGTDLAKRNVAPVPVVDVLRAAVSEIEQYQRVVVQPPPVATVAGRAASDLVHLLAELLDNATNFSPPDSQVVMSTTRAGDGSLIIEIADRGVGMAEHELAEANQRLASPAAVDVSASRRMGLFVVGRLANRHGLGIRLGGGMAGASGGLTASVTVPAVLVPSAEPPERQPVRAGVAPALAAGQGASAFGGGPATTGTGTVPAPRPAGQPPSLSSLVQGDDGPMSPASALGGGRPPAPPVNGKGLPQRRPGSVPPQDEVGGPGPDDGFDAFGTGAAQAERRDERETTQPSDEGTRRDRGAGPAGGDPAPTGRGPGDGVDDRAVDGQRPDGQRSDGQGGRQAPEARPAGPERGPWPVESLRRPPNGSTARTRPTNGHSFHGERPGASDPAGLPALPKRTPRGSTPDEATDGAGTREERSGDRPTGREQEVAGTGTQPDRANGAPQSGSAPEGSGRTGAPEHGAAEHGATQEEPQKSGSDRPAEKLGRGVAAAGAALAGAAAGLAGAAGLRKSEKDRDETGTREDDARGTATGQDGTAGNAAGAGAGRGGDATADDGTPPAGSAAAEADTPVTGNPAAARNGGTGWSEVTTAEAEAGPAETDEPVTTRFPVTRFGDPTPTFSPTADAATTVPSAGAPDVARTTEAEGSRPGSDPEAGAAEAPEAAAELRPAGEPKPACDSKSADGSADTASGTTGIPVIGTEHAGTEHAGTEHAGTEDEGSEAGERAGADRPGRTGAAPTADSTGTSPAERTDGAGSTDTTTPAAVDRGAGVSGTSGTTGGPDTAAPGAGGRTPAEPLPPTVAGLPRRTPGVNGGQRPSGPPPALPRRGEEPEARPERPAAAAPQGSTGRTAEGTGQDTPESTGQDIPESTGLLRRVPGTSGRPANRAGEPSGAPAGVEGSQGLPRRTPGNTGADGRPSADPTGPAGLPRRRPGRPMTASSEGTEALFAPSTPADSSSTGQLRRPGGFESRTPSSRRPGASNGIPPTGAGTAGGSVTPGVEQTGGTPPAAGGATGTDQTDQTDQIGQNRTGRSTAPQDPAGSHPTGSNTTTPNPAGPNPTGTNPAGHEPGATSTNPYRNGGALAYGSGTPGAPGVPSSPTAGLPKRRPSPGPQAAGPAAAGPTATGPAAPGTNGTGANGTGPHGTATGTTGIGTTATGTTGIGTSGNGTDTATGPTGTVPDPSTAAAAPSGPTGAPAGAAPGGPLGAPSAGPTGGPDEPADGPSRFDLGHTTPIFEEIASAWFRSNRSVPVRWTDGEDEGTQGAPSGPPAGHPLRVGRPAGGDAGFATAADEGWRVADATAAATAAETERGASETTEAGLPKRRPRARLVPGSAAGSAVLAPPSGPARNAEAIRGRLASYQQGVRQGRESRLRRQSAAGTGTGQTRSTTEQDEEK